MLELLIRRRRGHEQSMSVPGCESPNDARPADARVHDRYDIGQLCLERAVKVGTPLQRDERVGVREFGEYADVAAVLELCACMRWREIKQGNFTEKERTNG